MQTWLMKTEPEVFSLDDLRDSPGGTAPWDGVRNYQSRNTMRDQMQRGDRVLIYHSGQKDLAIAGVASVAREAYPDHTAWNPEHDHFDPRSTVENPVWVMIDVRFEWALPRSLTLNELRTVPELTGMVLLRKGMRLSVQPVTEAQFQIIAALARRPAPEGLAEVAVPRAKPKSTAKPKTAAKAKPKAKAPPKAKPKARLKSKVRAVKAARKTPARSANVRRSR
jgi:predicted RNA-binding protein with PUA-like domain